jgi:Tfp pilus assembly protein PilV
MHVGGRRPASPVDGGFALMEVVVGMVLFAIVLVAGLGLVVQASRVAAANVRRTTAANLLTAQLEAARAARLQDLPDGSQDSTVAVGGTAYAVHQVTGYATRSEMTTLCQSVGTDVFFKLVNVTITWPAMQGVAPVHGSTLLAVGVGRQGSAASRGTMVVTVRDAAGDPASGARVTVGDQSRLADATGCVIFADLPSGSYSGDAVGAAGSPAADQTGIVPATDLPAGYVRHVSVDLAPPPPPPPPPTTDPAPVPSSTDPNPDGGGDVPTTDDGGGGGGTDPAATGTDPGSGDVPPDSGGGSTPPPAPTTTPPPPPEWQAS